MRLIFKMPREKLTRMTAVSGSTLMDMQYNYPATQNNGRITSSNDYVWNETVTYGYDALNRLSSASAGSAWNETFGYDGLTGDSLIRVDFSRFFAGFSTGRSAVAPATRFHADRQPHDRLYNLIDDEIRRAALCAHPGLGMRQETG